MTAVISFLITAARFSLAFLGWVLLAVGLVVLSWATWQFSGFLQRQPCNGEGYWGFLAFLYFALPGALMLGLSVVFFLARHCV